MKEGAMAVHEMARTTHTVELRQVAEVNAALASGRRRLTAGSIGVRAGVTQRAVLKHLECQGPPSYPYIYGHFDAPTPGAQDARVELHTAQLRAISDQLALRSQIWGQ
jgi:hypothetical protein